MTSTFRLVQRGPDGSPLVALWLVGPQADGALRSALPDCTILASATIDMLATEQSVRATAPWATGRLVLGAWSEGVMVVRKILRDGAKPDAIVTADGTHANYPTPEAWQIETWRETGARARAGACVWAASCTQNTYVEALRDDPKTARVEAPFMATVHVLERALSRPLPPGAELHDGGLHVYSLASARIDKAAHEAQLNVWLPRMLRDHVAPFLAPPADQREPAPPPPTLPTGAAPTLHVGDTDATTHGAVSAWQRQLVALGFHIDCDGRFGPNTRDATRHFQEAHSLTADGIVGPRTRAAAADAAPPVRIVSSAEWPAVCPYAPLTDKERADIFGRFDFVPAPTRDNPEGIRILGDWEARNIVSVEIPQLANISGAPTSCRVSFHRLGADALKRLFQAWEDTSVLRDLVQFSGTWNPRFVRGSLTVLSNHATGTAIDLNAGYNARGTQGAAMGARGDMRRLAAIAFELGWESGHFFPTRDDMHIQLGRKVIGDPNL